MPGGGVALLRTSSTLDKLTVPDEERFGVQIVRRACEAPRRHRQQAPHAVEKIEPGPTGGRTWFVMDRVRHLVAAKG